MYQYPYGNSQQLNLDWIINKLIELEASWQAGEAAELEDFCNALISLTYDPTQPYNNSDIVFHDGHLYRCNTNIPAPGEVWDPSHWDQIMLGNTVANLVRAVAGMDSDHVFNESNVSGTHVTEALNALVEDIRYNNHFLQQKKNGAYTDVIPVEDTPSNNSDRLASSKAAYDLKGALNGILKENLLRNAYFKDPINSSGQTSWDNIVTTRGAECIDDWLISATTTDAGGINLTSDGFVFPTKTTYRALHQLWQTLYGLELAGKTVTLSALVRNYVGSGLRLQIGQAVNITSIGTSIKEVTFTEQGTHIFSITAQIPAALTNPYLGFNICSTVNNSSSFTVEAMKLEIGDTQTLGYYDGSDWKLYSNEPALDLSEPLPVVLLSGDVGTFKQTRVALRQLSSLETPANSAAYQGCDIFDGKLFACTGTTQLLVSDLNTAETLYDLVAPISHANSACFSNEYNGSNTIPLLYASTYADKTMHCFDIDLANETITDAKTYVFSPDVVYGLQCAFDKNNNKIIVVSYDANSVDAGTTITVGIYPLESATLVSGTKYQLTADYTFKLPFIPRHQDVKFINGLLYLVSSNTGQTPLYTNIYAIDPYKKAITGVIDGDSSYMANIEIEGIAHWNDKLLLISASAQRQTLTI